MTTSYSPSVVQKEWALVYAERILLSADSKDRLRQKARRTRTPEGAEILAVPKPQGSIWL